MRGKLGVPGAAPDHKLGVCGRAKNQRPRSFSYLFESNNIHLLSGATELLPAEPVCCTPSMNKWLPAQVRSPERLIGRFFGRSPLRGCLIASSVGGGRPFIQSFK